MPDLSSLLASANLLDLASYTEHAIGCPSWYAAHAPDNATTQGKPCDCGLAEQLEAVRVMTEFVRELFASADEGTHRVEQTARDSVLKVEALQVSELGASRPHRVIRHVLLYKRNALRLAADLIRACAEVDAAGKGVG